MSHAEKSENLDKVTNNKMTNVEIESIQAIKDKNEKLLLSGKFSF